MFLEQSNANHRSRDILNCKWEASCAQHLSQFPSQRCTLALAQCVHRPPWNQKGLLSIKHHPNSHTLLSYLPYPCQLFSQSWFPVSSSPSLSSASASAVSSSSSPVAALVASSITPFSVVFSV